MSEPQEILEQFERFAGEKKFRQFVYALDHDPISKLRKQCPGLLFWQEDLWKSFSQSCGLDDIPTDYAGILTLFAQASRPQKTELYFPDVPDWCEIEYIGGVCPVQAWGRCFDHAWYFRARWEKWSLEMSREKVEDVDDVVFGPDDVVFGPDVYRLEQDYGIGKEEAGYMYREEALHFIVTGLKKLLADAGIAIT